MRFHDRADAGNQLAIALESYKNQKPLVIYALPRGGVVLGAIVAKHLGAPLSLVIPRKVGHPFSPEYAVAAVTEEGAIVANPAEIAGLDEKWFKIATERGRKEAKRRRLAYLRGRPDFSPDGKTAIIIDDGAATGLTMLAAIAEIRSRRPVELIAALPVVPYDVFQLLNNETDKTIALITPRQFAGTVGSYYETFNQVDDEEVVGLLWEVNLPKP